MRSVMFSPITGDERLLATTNPGGFARPFLWNPRTGNRTQIDLGKTPGEVVPWDCSQDGRKLLMTVVDHAVFRLFVYDLATSDLTEIAHGGPSAVMTDLYLPEAQAWIDHGFVFCSINYHGSITFGADFRNCINGNLGELETQDVAAGVQWLVEQGRA